MKRSDFRFTRHNVLQFLEYMVGGSIYFWSGYVVFAVVYSGLHRNWLQAKIAADIIGWTLNYVVQRYWAFANKKLTRHEGRTATKYAALMVANLGLDYLIIWGLKAIGISPYIGFFVSAGFFTVWNYVWYRFWVFFVSNKHKGA